ncbi:MAG: hypothetical protein AAF413_01985 [Patescibacteria group bacterium]
MFTRLICQPERRCETCPSTDSNCIGGIAVRVVAGTVDHQTATPIYWANESPTADELTRAVRDGAVAKMAAEKVAGTLIGGVFGGCSVYTRSGDLKDD